MASEKQKNLFSVSETLLAETIRQSKASIMITDLQGKYLYVNQSFLDLFAVQADDVLDHTIEDFNVDDNTKMALNNALRSTVLKAETPLLRSSFTRIDGSKLVFESRFFPLRYESDKVTHVVVIGRDVTNEIELQNQLQQSQKLESIGRLAAGIAHEINTPTQFVGDNLQFMSDSYSDLLVLLEKLSSLKDLLDIPDQLKTVVQEIQEEAEDTDLSFLLEEIPKSISQAREGVMRVSAIVNAMKEFSHPGTTGKELTNLNRCIENTVLITKNEWKYVSDVQLELDPQLPVVPCLPGEFNQVILNLVTNSAHSIGEKIEGQKCDKGTITITTEKEETNVLVTLSDSGMGIPEEIRINVFDPFFTTKEFGKGTGQGLAIARNVIVDKLQGTIDFTSEPGKGTTFYLRIPINSDVS